jgi:uncharacterized protein (DUF983 family)
MTTETKLASAPAKKVPPAAGARKAKQRTWRSATKGEKLVCRYCGSDDLAPSFIKRRDARCRDCFKKRYGSARREQKATRRAKKKAAK